jgi:predicted DCC family thiol-disulfide oxidoreductase YuxK
MEKDIIIFDGDCNFCNKYVNFVIAHDHANGFVFTSSQSATGQILLNNFNADLKCVDSIVLISGKNAFTRSDAVLGIIKHLDNNLWRLKVFKIIPRRIRDFLYTQFAKRRYLVSGKSTYCSIPTPELMSRFLK